MLLTYYGHSCFELEANGKKLLFDPFITPNPAAATIDINSINPDYILLTHAHQDHIADAETVAKSSGALLIGSFEVVSWFENKGVEHTQPLNAGGSKQFDFGRVKGISAVHSSSFPDGTYGGLAQGYVIESEGKSIYFSGDTALFSDMKLIKDEFSITAAVLPVGDIFTMGIDDALKAADFVGTDKVIGMHFDTWPVIEIDHEKAFKKAEAAEKQLILPKIGQKTEI